MKLRVLRGDHDSEHGAGHQCTGRSMMLSTVAGEQLGRGAASRLLLEIDVGERLPVMISGDETIQGGGKRRAVGME